MKHQTKHKKCEICKGLQISIYAHVDDGKKISIRHIGEICPVHDKVKNPSPFLDILKKQREQREQKKKKPIFSRTEIKKQCEKCKSKKIKIRNIPESITVKEDKPQKQWNVNRNNPSIQYKCDNCKHEWSEMYKQIPEKPKYLLPKKMSAFQLRLVLQNFPKEVIKDFIISKNLKKMRDKIIKELERERNVKVLREIEERQKRKS